MATSNVSDNGGKGLAVASLTLGVLAIVLFWTWILAIILGVLAIIFGALSLNSAYRKLAIAGLTTGIAAILICVLVVVVIFTAIPALQNNQTNTERKADLSSLVSEAISYETDNKGAVPTAADLSTSGLQAITSVVATGEPTQETAVYSAGVGCNGQSVARTSFSIKIKLSDGTTYCQDS